VPWSRPVPLIGDASSAGERAADPQGWAFRENERESLYAIVASRRDVRRFRPDPVADEVVHRILSAAHQAPSVGQSQPWRFLIVDSIETRERAAWIADRERIAQAALLEPQAARQLLDLQLEGLREAPLGIVVCCDRRVPASGVLGRSTFVDADMWSAACAIQNLWLAARAEGLGVGWVTLFPPKELEALVGLPDDVETLGWLCVGWPDERPPEPGLERAGWSKKLGLDDVVIRGHWPKGVSADPPVPVSRLRAPAPEEVVAPRDQRDTLLTPPSSLGVLDRAADRIIALGHPEQTTACLVLVAGDHQVSALGVTAYKRELTAELLRAAHAGSCIGVATASNAKFSSIVIDAGTTTGDLAHSDPLQRGRVEELIELGRITGVSAANHGLVLLGEIGMGNTTVAAALSAHILGKIALDVVGLGSGSDSRMLDRKREVVDTALERVRGTYGVQLEDPITLLGCLGGPEFAYLTGVVLGAAQAGQAIVLDGMATTVPAILAAMIEPALSAHLIAGQRSREQAHSDLLGLLGLEPLLDLRIRAGEGVGAVLAAQLLLTVMATRKTTASFI
jgi:nicotinate-nucleotide--dimethylbenzimidazole phosphoribosyltransferase